MCMNKTVRKLKSQKLKMWRKLKKDRSPKNRKKYKKAAKALKMQTISNQEKEELKIVNSKNLGSFYKYVNICSVHKTGIGPLKNAAGKVVLENGDKAELLNSYFTSVCINDNGASPALPSGTEDADTLNDISFRPEQIRRSIKKFKNKTSSGPDGLPNMLFKQLSHQLAYPLAVIFNIIMLAGNVPEIWKQAIVTPIFKKGTSSNPKNYRPISLTCVGSKIFESIIKNALVPFLERKHLLSHNQHGFRSKHSTCLNLIECVNDWTGNLDSKIDTLIAHIDFARAFDSVSLPKLLHKLKWAGISENLLACIKSLLQGRTQRVKIENSLSTSLPVTSGVPQGSVLGPILFIFCINDINEVVVPPSTSKLYADDVKAFCPASNDTDLKAFNETLRNITDWATTWQLPISTEKSRWLLVTNKKAETTMNFHFELAKKPLPRVTEVIDLGINFNSRLNFSNHISAIIAQAKQRLFLMKKSFRSRNSPILIVAFKTYIIPILEYCSPVWNPHTLQDVRRIESVQRLFTKKLPGFEGLSYPARLEKAQLSTLELRRMRADLCLCYNIVHQNVDSAVSNFFEIEPSSLTRGHSWKLKSSVPRLDSRLHFFSHRITRVWNSLSEKTVSANSISSFKARLDSESFDKFLLIKD